VCPCRRRRKAWQCAYDLRRRVVRLLRDLGGVHCDCLEGDVLGKLKLPVVFP
jgi:hypothetical protein